MSAFGKFLTPADKPRPMQRGAAKGGSGEGPAPFMVDAMLGSLARKLRMLGFDAEYSGQGNLGRTALAGLSAEGRVLVTRSRALAERARGAGASAVVLPQAGTAAPGRDAASPDESDLAEVARQSGIARFSADPDRSRCAACNGALSRVEGDAAPPGVPPRVAEACSEFWRCGSCSKVYWDGTHMRDLALMAARLNG